MKRLLGIILVLTLAGCSSSGGGNDSGGSSSGQLSGSCSLKITGGVDCPSGDGPVALIEGRIGGQLAAVCSGSLIAPNAVLTAAHCVEGIPADAAIKLGSREVQVTGRELHPSYGGEPTQVDVGIFYIAPQNDITPLPIFVSRSVNIGDDIVLMGYGANDSGLSNPERDPNMGPSRADMSVVDLDSELIVAVRVQGGSGGCEGDSGGPVLAQNGDGLWGIVGIIVGGTTATCEAGTINVFSNMQSGTGLNWVLSSISGVGLI